MPEFSLLDAATTGNDTDEFLVSQSGVFKRITLTNIAPVTEFTTLINEGILNLNSVRYNDGWEEATPVWEDQTYSNPSWLTALDYAKITGLGSAATYDYDYFIPASAYTTIINTANSYTTSYAVPLVRTINGYDLSSNVTLTKNDIGLDNVENTALSTWAGSTSITTLGTISAGTVPVARVSGLGTLATQSGTFSGTSSGTNTGDQTITLTGDVTGSGTGSFAATIGSNKVTAAKMSASTTNILFGRSTAGSGGGEEIACTSAGRALIDDADNTAQRTTLGLGTIATQASSNVSITGGTALFNTGLIASYNGVAGKPNISAIGTWFTGGTSSTTKPHVLIEPIGTTSSSWSTSGSGLGINAASGFTGNLIDIKTNDSGVSRFVVDAAGRVGMGVAPVSSPSFTARLNISQTSTNLKAILVELSDSRTTAGLKIQDTNGANLGLIGGCIVASVTNISSVGDTAENDLISYTVPANLLAVNNDSIILEAVLDWANHATYTKRLRLYFAGTAIYDSAALLTSDTATRVRVEVARQSSTTVKIIVTVETSLAIPLITYTLISGIDLTTTNILKATTQMSGSTTGLIISRFYKIYYSPGA